MNIAEGSAKKGSREFKRYLDIALGSTSELSYCLFLARDLGFLPVDEWKNLERRRAEAGRLLWKLHQKIGKAILPPSPTA
jgi:four helix bundle protein